MNILVTICQPTVYEKPQKMAFFRPRDTFVTNTPCFLGSKFEYYLTNNSLAKFAVRVYQARTFAMPNGNNRSDKYAPERGNEPPAQGNALGNKGNITNGIHRQG